MKLNMLKLKDQTSKLKILFNKFRLKVAILHTHFFPNFVLRGEV